MAGPGGGPPRRSHTKSRKGCDTCKKRHIRCDENFPQCRNCTKHKIRCPYNDMPIPEDRASTPDKPDLMWTPEIEAALEQWQLTGIFPFPALNIYPPPSPQNYTLEDLRLMYHVASICNQLVCNDADHFTIWTRQIPTILRIGATNNYVMQALMAFSAMHIALLTNCPLVGNMAYEYRGQALKGLHEAINTFSRESSDAVLAASLVLSWQATDWRSWTQLMQGTSSVMDAMQPWKHESQFGDFIAESSTFPTAPPSPSPDHRPSQPRDEDYAAFNQTVSQLQKVEAFLKAGKEDTKSIAQLSSFVRSTRKFSPTIPVSQQFDRLRQLREWLFLVPVMYLQQSSTSASSLLIIAHYYAVALVMERLFPEIGAAYFGSLCIGPVEEIARRLHSLQMSGLLAEHGPETPLTLMRYPIAVVEQFRSRMGWAQPVRTPSFPQFTEPTFYMSEPVPMPPVSETYLPYASNPSFSYSTESLPMLSAPEQGPNSAISPLSLSSPFASHYLSIPSPSYAGPYSPASSAFEGSLAYSDTEDYGHFDMSGLTASAPMDMLGGASNHMLGVGFVSPIQPVWN